MKYLIKKLKTYLVAGAAIVIGASPMLASDLSYTDLAPLSNDQDVQIVHKQALALAPRLYVNAATSGTYQMQALTTSSNGVTQTSGTYAGMPAVTGTQTVSELEAVIVDTASTSGSCVLLDGTNPIGMLQTSAVGRVPYGVELHSGSLSAVLTGTANVTITYR